MTLAGLDLNATCARAVGGPEGLPPRVLSLDDGATTAGALPLALSLQGRHAEVGQAGAGLCREFPHLVCLDFLAHLGTDRFWTAGRHRLTATTALALVLDCLRPALANVKALSVALPAYLNEAQAALVMTQARKAKLPVVGSVAAPLALALAAYAEKPWAGLAVLVDADDHALTWTILKASPDKLQILDGKTVPHLNLRVWKGYLLDAIADCCIHHSRRDPRDSGSAEQLLYDQLDDVFEAVAQHQLVEVIIRATSWCQNLILQPRQVGLFCAPLVQEAAEEVGTAFASALLGTMSVVLVSAAVGRLPGLVGALQEAVGDRVPVQVLPPDATARAGWELAGHFLRGAGRHWAPSHEHLMASLPLSPAARSRPASQVPPRLAADR
jgi:hypothetical protein